MAQTDPIELEFPGGLKVATTVRGHRILTDQPVEYGGDDAAPAPFDFFLASLATCAGFFVLRFCQKRDLPAEGIRVVQRHEMDEESKTLKRVVISVETPESFPSKYLGALARSVEQCSVKRAIAAQPEMAVEVSPASTTQPASRPAEASTAAP